MPTLLGREPPQRVKLILSLHTAPIVLQPHVYISSLCRTPLIQLHALPPFRSTRFLRTSLYRPSLRHEDAIVLQRCTLSTAVVALLLPYNHLGDTSNGLVGVPSVHQEVLLYLSRREHASRDNARELVGKRWERADVILGSRDGPVRSVHSDEHVMDLFLTRKFKLDVDVDPAWPNERRVQIFRMIGA